jgi:hypothetical protein
MAGRPEIVGLPDPDPDTVSPARSPLADEEKTHARATEGQWGDQIPQHLLDELAPNGEGAYILDKVNSMSEEEALAIIEESLKFHADDWNFPSDMRERMRRLLLGPKQYPSEFWDRDLRIDAVMLKWSSPYPGVRAVANPVDDESVPIETFRAYFLGIGWAVIGTFMATFFNSRFPSISLGGAVIQILLFPCGRFLQTVLPDWGFTVGGTRHSLNPGPWTFKEQMFATITYNIAIYTTNSYTMILVQKSPIYYGETFITFWAWASRATSGASACTPSRPSGRPSCRPSP